MHFALTFNLSTCTHQKQSQPFILSLAPLLSSVAITVLTEVLPSRNQRQTITPVVIDSFLDSFL